MMMLILLAVVLATAGYGIYRAKKAAEDISIAAFGVRSLKQGIEQQADLLAETPKSVAGMTKVYLPQIEKDFPEFNWAQFKQMADNMLMQVLAAIGSGDMSHLSDASPELQSQIRLQIADLERRGQRERYSAVKIHKTEISHYIKSGGLCVLKLQSAVEYFHDVENISGDRAEHTSIHDSEDNRRMEQTKYETELVYIQDIEKVKDKGSGMALICPQCGAPVTRLGGKFCEYCGAGITPVNIHVWSIHKVKQLI